MCVDCLRALRAVFPEVPDEEAGGFLLGTTCYPFGGPRDVYRMLRHNRRKMDSDDYRECYGIADSELTAQMKRFNRVGTDRKKPR